MPWGVLIREIEGLIADKAPKGARVLDMLCGPGYLLGKLAARRPDIVALGVDVDPTFIEHARRLYPDVSFEVADAVIWDSKERFDVIVCTAGLHHLEYEKQEPFIRKLSGLLNPAGFAVIGDPYIDDFSNEEERKIAGAKLGHEYLVETIKNGGSEDVVRAAIDVLSNDVLLVEYKSSIKKNKPLFEKHFSHVEMHKTWPKEESGYGDYYFIVRN